MPFTFTRLSIPDLILIKPRVFPDERGFFCETYKLSEFAANGIPDAFVQDNHSSSSYGVLRGLHYQLPPHGQGKLVRVIGGRIWDVGVDIRRSSPTFGKWAGAELSDENMSMLWIPPGFAHGFVTLSESVHLLYKCTSEYDKGCERGIRWNDEDIGIEWPIKEVLVSKRDESLPSLKNATVY
jgi:dTDP-4-dehydrorhamnose 3,5-epimerase